MSWPREGWTLPFVLLGFVIGATSIWTDDISIRVDGEGETDAEG